MNEFDTMIKVLALILIFLLELKFSQYLDVYQTPGKLGHYLTMTRYPGKIDFEELSVCLRYTTQEDVYVLSCSPQMEGLRVANQVFREYHKPGLDFDGQRKRKQ